MTRSAISFFLIFLFLTAQPGCFAQDVFNAVRRGDTLRIIELMKLNPDTIHKANKDGFSPLIIACYRGQPETAEFLLRRKVNIDFVSPEGTALMAAVYKNEEDLVRKLLQKKANPDLTNDLGTTALMMAVSGNQKKMVQLLLEYKCNKNLKDKEGRTALQIAETMSVAEIIAILER